MKRLVKFDCDCGRMGSLFGLFVVEPNEYSLLLSITQDADTEIYFGEVLGKHSEVFITLTKRMFKILSDDQEYIAKHEATVGATFGYNPLDRYLEQREDEDEEE